MLTFRNEKGEIEGVKYNQLSAVFINAFKEQEAQIAKQNEEIKKQQALIAKQSLTIRRQEDQFIQQQIQLDRLTKLVCRSHRHAWACK